MAIDTAVKRRSSVAARRMPWMRRFTPKPDGSVSQADRQQGPWVYVGIAAAEVVADATINICLTVEICTALEFTTDICTALAFDAPICTGLEFTASVGGMC
jgi:hypothetical protein